MHDKNWLTVVTIVGDELVPSSKHQQFVPITNHYAPRTCDVPYTSKFSRCTSFTDCHFQTYHGNNFRRFAKCDRTCKCVNSMVRFCKLNFRGFIAICENCENYAPCKLCVYGTVKINFASLICSNLWKQTFGCIGYIFQQIYDLVQSLILGMLSFCCGNYSLYSTQHTTPLHHYTNCAWAVAVQGAHGAWLGVADPLAPNSWWAATAHQAKHRQAGFQPRTRGDTHTVTGCCTVTAVLWLPEYARWSHTCTTTGGGQYSACVCV